MKKTPMSSFCIPFFTALSLTNFADNSIGDSNFTRFSIKLGKRTCISLTTAGHADEIKGFFAF